MAIRAPWRFESGRAGRCAPCHEGARVFERSLTPDGRIASVGVTHRPEEDAAAAATGLSAGEAAAWTPAGATAPAALVCDGPVGREAWFAVVRDGASERWTFATGGGQYERSAGTPPRGGIVDDGV